MASRVKDGVVPPGGWHFIQPLGGGRKLTVRGTSFDTLVTNVLTVRLENDIAPGEVRQEVEDYICALSKTQCYRRPEEPVVSGPVSQPPAGPPDRWVDTILAWANFATRSRTGMGGLTSSQVAEERARQCASCPLNRRWQNSCPSCVSKTNNVLSRLRQGQNVSNRNTRDTIGGCSHHRWDNQTAAFFAEPEGRPLEGAVNPVSGCWAGMIVKE